MDNAPGFMTSRKYLIALIVAAGYCVVIGFTILHESGQVGTTRKTGGIGCVCHGANATDSVLVWIAGPDSVRHSSTTTYTILMRGGPALAGGFNVAVGSGVLSAPDESSHVQNGELTHSFPRLFQDDTVRWRFLYQAPASGTADTIFSVGNSVNLNGIPLGDQWNFGSDFVVSLRGDTSLGVAENRQFRSFQLYQNFPNPFNPVTLISYLLPAKATVTLTIHDVFGQKLATLVDEVQDPGYKTVTWVAGSRASGVYFYRLQAGGRTEVRKMLVLH